MAKFILGDGSIVSPDNAESVAQLRRMGVQEATPQDLKVDSLREQYSSLWYAPEAAALGVAEGAFPGAVSTVIHGIAGATEALGVGQDVASTTADFVQGVEAGNPWSNRAGMAVGLLGSPVGKAVGWAKTALTGGVQAAAMAADTLAVEHIQSPEGMEKITATLGISFLFGNAFSVGGKALGKWLSKGGAAVAGEKLVEKGGALQASANLVNNPGVQAKLEEAGATDTVAALADKYNLLTKAPKAVKNTLKEVETAASKTLNEIKTVSTKALPADAQAAFAAEVQPLLSDVPALAKRAGSVESVGELHQLRIAIREKVTDFKDLSNPYNARLNQAYNRVSQHIEDTLAANEGLKDSAQNLVGRWKTANADYAAVQALKKAAGSAEPLGKSTLAKLGGKVAALGAGSAGYGVIGGNPGAVAGGAAAFVAGKGLQAAGSPVVQGAAVAGLGKLLQQTDKHIVQTVVAGLTRTGGSSQPASAAIGAQLAKLVDYDAVAAGVQHVSENPSTAVPRMAQAMEEHGIPGQIIDSVVPQQIKNAQYLKSVKPVSPWLGKTVAPAFWQPTVGEKAKFIDQVNAVNNPLWALHNATPARVAAVKAVYPILHQRFATMVAQEASANPDLPLAARKWAEAVTGIPAYPGNSASRMVYDAQRAEHKAAVQEHRQRQAQGGGGASGGSSAILDSSTTRLGRMSE